ncbi:hypothetical protein HUV48_10570 [Altererythrobacter sp. HHU K3-1]|uniref:Sulfotransferase domain-containing protein n=1 Tax=Qipengyuania atrilutea TaxID=2744473 RepID=A0A850HE36_9SPHN|nr:hypothetical protein [Actirhodobacter atriluteus]
MSDLDTIRENPEWMPHRLDLQEGEVEFVRLPQSRFAEAGFLFEYRPSHPSDTFRIAVDKLAAFSVPHAPLHFIFHTAFCRSTLLSRALNIRGIAIGLSEPPIIADLASGGEATKGLIRPLLHLLARARPGGEAVFVKPTNHANRLIPQLLDAAPKAHAILMTNSLDPFLRSVRRRGLIGHRWGRKLYLEMQSYAGMDFGMPPEETFAMTDLQTAGAAWLLNQRYFDQLASSRFAERLRVLNGDYFNDSREETIAAVLDFCGLDIGTAKPATEIFAAHAKTGGPVRKQADDQILNEEIGQVRHWVDLIADQIGITVPTAQTLR